MRLLTGLIAVIAVGTAAQAAPNLDFSIGLCAAKTDATARLACYDAIAAKLQSGEVVAPAAAPSAPVAPVAAAPAVTPVRPLAPVAAPAPVPAPVAAAPVASPEARFGAETLAKQSQKASNQPEEVEEIHAAVGQFAFAPNGRVIITLDNGQVWRQIDGDTATFRGKVGDKVKIERALFGSYSLTIEGRTMLFKVKRIR